jgi:thiol-disulfide isomerase/thioredoxin
MRLIALSLWVIAIFFTADAQVGPGRIDAAEAARLEAVLEKQPGKVIDRWELLNYYFTSSDLDPAVRREARRRHILWMIANHPEDPRLNLPVGSLHMMGPMADSQGFMQAMILWRQQAVKPDARPEAIAAAAEIFKMSDRPFAFQVVGDGLKRMPDAAVLQKELGALDALTIAGATATNQYGQVSGWDPTRAASAEAQRARTELEASSNADLLTGAGTVFAQQYMAMHSPQPKLAEQIFELGERCLQRALEKHPSDVHAENALALLYVSASNFAGSPDKTNLLEKAWSSSHSPDNKAYVIGYLADAHYQAGRVAEAARDAADMLQYAETLGKTNWNYGNLVHEGHTLLGRIDVKKNDLASAREHLLAAGRTPGSPQLNSFGPKWTLARELLNHGETNAVLDYVSLCRAFWKSGSDRLDEFAATIRSGATPDFDHPKVKIVNMAGQAATGFRLPQLSGPPVSLADYKGKVVVLDFWATWCSPCRAEMPIFEKLHRELAAKDVVILALDVNENDETVGAFIEKEKYTFPVLLAIGSDIAASYHVDAYPTTVVIDKSGRIADYLVGSRPEVDLRAAIERGRRGAPVSTQAAALHELAAPALVSPPEGAVFSHFPRITQLAWQPVPGTDAYMVEADYQYDGKWFSEDNHPRVIDRVDQTVFMHSFVGAQPGRWRVWAVDAAGHAGPMSPWREFRYTR